MAIVGQQNINIGAENQAQNSDNLYDAFNKVQNNFTTLFDTASPYNTFVGNLGISTTANSGNGTVFITNTGVLSVSAGTGVTVSQSTGNIVISVSGDANGNIVAGVTSVGVQSSSLDVSTTTGGNIVGIGNIIIDLPYIPTGSGFSPGEYVSPTLTVDEYGRITEISSTAGVGTVTSVAIQALGNGLQVVNSPITSSGTIQIKNTGVIKLNAGLGIELSGSNGEVTITQVPLNAGTVTFLEVTSNNLLVSGSPVTTTGNISINMPEDISLSGNIEANTLSANLLLSSDGDLAVTGNATIGNITADNFYGNFLGSFNGTVGLDTPNTGTFTTVTTNNVISANVTVNGSGNYLKFANNSGNYTSFVTPANVTNASYYVPSTTGNVYSVLGITATGSTNTLGWKTIPVQYVTIKPRTGSNFQVPYKPVLRTLPILTRTGYVDIALT